LWIAGVEIFISVFIFACAQHVPHKEKDDAEEGEASHRQRHVLVFLNRRLTFVTIIRIMVYVILM